MFEQLENDPQEWNELFLPEKAILSTTRFRNCALLFSFGVIAMIRFLRHPPGLTAGIVGVLLSGMLFFYLCLVILRTIYLTRHKIAIAPEQSTFLLSNARDRLRRSYYWMSILAMSLYVASMWT